MKPLPTFDDVLAASERLAGRATRTPLLTYAVLDALTGAEVYIKPETLQRTGSFKFRGAYNRITLLQDSKPGVPVVACSSGNHAQGVAAAAALHGIGATIVMPKDAPAIKRERTAELGAELVLYDRDREDREAIAERLCQERGAVFIPPYDDADIMAGQGTVGLEVFQDAARDGHQLDAILVPCGGGGLTAGVALALSRLSPTTELYTVEPEGFDDHARSFRSGQRERNPQRSGSICDALMAGQPGELTFAVNSARVSAGLTVSDGEALAAMAFAFRELKLVLEPGGAVALAAVLAGKLKTEGRRIAVVISGGNVDPRTLAAVLTGERLEVVS